MIPTPVARWVWLALIVLQLVWFGWLYPPEWLGRVPAIMISALPLLIPTFWIWRLTRDALVIGGMILLLHFSFAVAEAWANPTTRGIALVQILLIVVYFLALPGLRRGRNGDRAEPGQH